MWGTKLQLFRQPQSTTQKGVHTDLLTARDSEHSFQGRKISPKRKFLGRIFRRHPGVIRTDIPAQNFGQGAQNPGTKNKHSMGADIHDLDARTSTTLRDFQKLRSEKLWAEFSFPNNWGKDPLRGARRMPGQFWDPLSCHLLTAGWLGISHIAPLTLNWPRVRHGGLEHTRTHCDTHTHTHTHTHRRADVAIL